MDFSWLAWPGWAGVQGIASVLGALAIVLAVIDFLIRADREGPDAIHFHIDRQSELRPVADPKLMKVTVTARAMGAYTLYEAQWRCWGAEPDVQDLELPPVLNARDEPVSLVLHLTEEQMSDAYVGLVWVTPRRWRSFASSARVSLARGSTMERWRRSHWPRPDLGRWVAGRDAGPRSRLIGPPD